MTRPSVPSTVPTCAGRTSAQAEPSDRAGLIRVLVVDDDARVRVAMAATISLEADMSLIGEAADASSAIDLAATSHFVVALVDVLLPDERTGLALVRALAARPRCAVVVLSVDSGVRGAALAAGATTFVEKADDIEALLRSIRAAAQSSS